MSRIPCIFVSIVTQNWRTSASRVDFQMDKALRYIFFSNKRTLSAKYTQTETKPKLPCHFNLTRWCPFKDSSVCVNDQRMSQYHDWRLLGRAMFVAARSASAWSPGYVVRLDSYQWHCPIVLSTTGCSSRPNTGESRSMNTRGARAWSVTGHDNDRCSAELSVCFHPWLSREVLAVDGILVRRIVASCQFENAIEHAADVDCWRVHNWKPA